MEKFKKLFNKIKWFFRKLFGKNKVKFPQVKHLQTKTLAADIKPEVPMCEPKSSPGIHPPLPETFVKSSTRPLSEESKKYAELLKKPFYFDYIDKYTETLDIVNIIPEDEEIIVDEERYKLIHKQFKNQFNFELQVGDKLIKQIEGNFMQLAGREYIKVKRNDEFIFTHLTKMN